jgi:ketosteroid isomerase-like protein
VSDRSTRPPAAGDVAPAAADANAARVREAYAAFAAGDGRALVALLSDEVVYHLPGNHLGGGTLRGRAEIFGRLATAAAALDAQPTIRIGAVVGSGEWVISRERFRARRGERVLDQDVCVVWRMSDGRCTEMWARFADQAACDRFWQ